MKRKWIRGIALGMAILAAGSEPLQVMGAVQTEGSYQEEKNYQTEPEESTGEITRKSTGEITRESTRESTREIIGEITGESTGNAGGVTGGVSYSLEEPSGIMAGGQEDGQGVTAEGVSGNQEEAAGLRNVIPEEALTGTADTDTAEREITGESEILGTKDEGTERLFLGQAGTEAAAIEADVEIVRGKLDMAMTYLKEQVPNPIVGTIGGDWSALAMARNGNLSETARSNYLSNLYQALEQNQGILDDTKYTEYSRVILTLTSMGIRPDTVSGYYNLLAMLSDYENVLYQGINGPIFALLALDSHSYEIPALSEEEIAGGKVQTTRENLIDSILERELGDGGWALSGNPSAPDMTAMAIQALAPYRGQREDVAQSVERGLSFLSDAQTERGGFVSASSSQNGELQENLESTTQVLIALSAMDVSLLNDSRFIKGENSVLDAVLSYQKEDGSFSHIPEGETDAMATDQGALGLLAYIRAKDGMTALYDMTDVQIPDLDTEEDSEVVQAFLDKVNALPSQVRIQDKDEVYRLLSELDLMGSFQEKEELRAKLNQMTQDIKQQEQQVQALDTAIWNRIDPLSISLKDKNTIEQMMEQYRQIPEANRDYLENKEDLLKAETILTKLEQGILAKEIFQNVQTSSMDYEYQGEGYSILLSGKNPYEERDMKAGVETWYEGNDFYFRITEGGKLPGVMKFEISCRLTGGWYQLEYKDGDSYKAQKKIYVNNEKFTFDTEQGGQYRLTSLQEEEETTSFKGLLEGETGSGRQSAIRSAGTSGSSNSARGQSLIPDKSTVSTNMVTAEVKDNFVSKEQVEKIKGTDRNLLMKGKLENGKEYTMTLHGEDISEAAEINIGIKMEGENDENIKLLAENPVILSFQQEGAFPGDVQVELPVEKEDGTYLLFRYNEEEGKAEVVQKIQVKDKSTKFVIKQGGDYFIDTRAKAKSVEELKLEDEDRWETLSVKDADEPEEEYFIGEGNTEPSGINPVWYAAGALGLAAAAGGIYGWRRHLWKKREKGKRKYEK